MGELPSEDRNNDRIWIRRIPFPLSAHLYVVFLRFPLKKPIVKKINCVRLIQKVCMDCVAIQVFYGLQERICACGEWSVDGNKGFIFSL